MINLPEIKGIDDMNYAIKIIISCLLFSVFYSSSAQVPINNAHIADIQNILQTLGEKNSFVENLNHIDNNVLPIGVKRTISGVEITVAISGVKWKAGSALYSVVARAIIPQGYDGKRQVLFFGADNIKGNQQGGLMDSFRLSLLQDVNIDFNNGYMTLVLKGGQDKRAGRAEGQTFMEVDCGGFKSFGLDAEVVFPEDFLLPIVNGEKVRGSFKTIVEDWNDIVVDIDIDPFQIKGLPGFEFSLETVTFDFSDKRNSQNSVFPPEYDSKYLLGQENVNLWRGVYAKNVSVTLPKSFHTNTNQRVTLQAEDLIIDDYGVSCAFTANDILPFDKGSAGGWKFSVDKFKFGLEANRLIEAGFEGKIGLPFKGNTTALGYVGNISANNEYLLAVNTTDQQEFDFSLFNAKAKLLPNSFIELKMVKDQFLPRAVLHGEMVFSDLGQDAKNSSTVHFRNLQIQTIEPYIQVDNMGYDGEIKLGSFPLSIDKFTLSGQGNRVEIGAGVKLTLGDKLFNGGTTLRFASKMLDIDGRKEWVYDGMKVDAINLDVDIADVLKLNGQVNWHRNDLVYGDGFGGDLLLKITDKLPIKMTGGFGRVEDLSYWYAQGSMETPLGIPIFAGISINGFSGGVSQHMVSSSNIITESLHPMTYKPDRNAGLELKSAISFAVAKKIAKGSGGFEIAFNRTGGLRYAGIYGYAEFLQKDEIIPDTDKLTSLLHNMQEKEKLILNDTGSLLSKVTNFLGVSKSLIEIPSNVKPGIRGYIGANMDFNNKIFKATSEVFVSDPAKIVTGVGPRGRAGWGELYADSKEWYLHIGRPDNRVGLRMGLGKILDVRTGAYFMAGSRIPEMPAPPSQVANILGYELNTLTRGRDIDALSRGNGLAFGGDLRVNTGDLTFLMMYANFDTGLGFDIMLKDYGNLQCKGRSGVLGWDGWYAQGQAYAYLQGELGVKINLWLLKTKVPVIKGGAATLLQAGLPDPSYFRGYLGVNLNILGIIKGKARFKLSIGDEYEPVYPGSSPLEMPIISDFSPSNGDSDANVFTMPQARFVIPMGKTIESTTESGTTTYRVGLKDFILRDKEGKTIEGKLVWNKYKDAVSFQAKEILPSRTELEAIVRVGFDELKGGKWVKVMTSGKEAVEERSCSFITGEAPNEIPISNIVYSYPVVDQKYFLTNQSQKGTIQLQFGQKYLFAKGFDYKICFESVGSPTIRTDFVYNEETNSIEFELPHLNKQTDYTMRIAYTSQGNNEIIEDSSVTLESTEDASITAVQKKAQAGTSDASAEILKYTFSTSVYSNFVEKMEDIKRSTQDKIFDVAGSMQLTSSVDAKEAFDEAEIVGVDKTQFMPLIKVKATLEEPYYMSVLPLLYDGYPYAGIRLQNRDENIMGIPPFFSVLPSVKYLTDFESGINKGQFDFPYTYDSSIVIDRDFRELRNIVVNNSTKVSQGVFKRLATASLPILKYGKYKVLLTYVLPDGTECETIEFMYNNYSALNK